MTQPPLMTDPPAGSRWRDLSARGRAARGGAGAVYLALCGACTLAAFWTVFNHWALYDDQGNNEWTLRLFVDGHAAYNQVFSWLGPFYFEVWGAVFKLFGGTVTTDRAGGIQVAIWVVASLGIAVSVHRATGRFTLAVASLAAAFGLLGTLQAEPLQGDSLVCLMEVALLAIVIVGMPRWPRAACAAIGAMCAALLLTKINVGAYAMCAVGFAAAMTIPSLARWRALRILAAVAFVAVGVAVMANMTLSTQWTQYFMVIVLASSAALAFVAWPSAPVRDEDSESSAHWPVLMVAGFGTCFIAILLVIFSLGTTPGALWNGIVVLASHQSSLLTEPTSFQDNAITWSVLSCCVAWGAAAAGRVRGGQSPLAEPIGGLLRVLAGVVVLFSLVSQWPFTIAPNQVFGAAMPLAWVVAFPPSQLGLTTTARFTRTAVAGLAIASALIAYPVAGTQVNTGAVLLVACGAIMIGDGWRELEWASSQPGDTGLPLRPRMLVALGAALAVAMVLTQIAQPLESAQEDYAASTALQIAGASKVRLNPVDATALDTVVADIKWKCRTLLTLPGVYSLNLWSGVPTPTTSTGGTAYWETLTATQQRHVIAAAVASKKPCVVIDTGIEDDYGAPSPTAPLIHYIDTDFVMFTQVVSPDLGIFQVELPKPAPASR
ncbi:MAG: hypothetical protein ABSG64_07385 [Solirubrobacteraceae bacterium]|jgi:hypothetical protein